MESTRKRTIARKTIYDIALAFEDEPKHVRKALREAARYCDPFSPLPFDRDNHDFRLVPAIPTCFYSTSYTKALDDGKHYETVSITMEWKEPEDHFEATVYVSTFVKK